MNEAAEKIDIKLPFSLEKSPKPTKKERVRIYTRDLQNQINDMRITLMAQEGRIEGMKSRIAAIERVCNDLIVKSASQEAKTFFQKLKEAL